ncbi:hypothetical protein GTCCBUS3UF5_16400 [Geobacillus thermoleovorans CCB_US3_UF5]|uniref:Uncharacterized protein n=1 Tax=Geobacillus thermoleovorans CCB_US3_UF5 TaxID=1111068 RepID=A0ABN3ZTD4_GEOTH|nr:hypothetical protein GTCCBUS3UF5_16400 [Geobacillus thermoleovorans CCB_US3_UF5]
MRKVRCRLGRALFLASSPLVKATVGEQTVCLQKNDEKY